MKQLTQLALLLALVLGISSNAKADLLIEPVVGYNLGYSLDVKFDSVAMASSNQKYTGGGGGSYGGRLGYQNFGLQLGLDYLKSSINMNDSDFKSNIATSEWAGFVGYEFPIMLRVYAGYIFAGSGTGKNKLDQTTELSKESGTKIGLGFTGLPFIDINLEYRRATWTQNSFGGTDYDGSFTYSTIMLGLSAPFTL